MTNLYENGVPDGRQAETPQPPSLFRPRYNPLSQEKKDRHDEIKALADKLAILIAGVPAVPRPAEHTPMRGTPEAVIFSIANDPEADVRRALRSLQDAVVYSVRALTY